MTKWDDAQRFEKLCWTKYDEDVYLQNRKINQKVYRNILEKIHDMNPLVLDVGAGFSFPSLMLDGGKKVVLDPMYNTEKRRMPDGVVPVCSMGELLPFGNNTFDIIVCLNVLEHTANPGMISREMYRVLKHNGLVVFSEKAYSRLHIGLSRFLPDPGHPVKLARTDI